MNIKKDVIKSGLEALTNFYPEFNRFIDLKGIDNVTEAWYNVFKGIQFTYELEEKDYISAIFEYINTNNKSPYFSDIKNIMKELYRQHEMEKEDRK